MKIDAGSLHRLVYNSLLFDTKSAKAYRIFRGALHMNTSDGHVYIEDHVKLDFKNDGIKEQQWVIGAEQSKKIEVHLRQSEGEISMYTTPDKMLKVVNSSGGEIVMSISLGEYAQQSSLFWDLDESQLSYPDTFAFNPDRLRKLALLQPRDYPVDTKVRTLDTGQDVLVFKKGPNLQGIYGTLDREFLRGEGEYPGHLW